ncbi:MAG: carboxypeptidase regulatory-like domain-containing protein [Alphaproteobacteria bacterium]|nr:carboxypeptidase regulatory-like domain-containing protein [Alphaproteobacteria bacterium]
MRNERSLTGASLLTIAVALGGASLGSNAFADALLSGTITDAGGEKMGGVTVSAKAAGSTITTSVYTDEAGNYYFPALPDGSYRVWAQALTYETAKGSVDLAAAKRQDFVLRPMSKDQDWVRQLPGDELLAALPGETPDDARMKNLVRKNCTGCHTPSFPLQHRFDEAGWTAVLDLMKHVNVLGTYQGPDHKANQTIETHEKELAAYLARARGPGQTSMKFNLRPRPSGEAARVVFKEYDVPLEPDTSTAVNPSTVPPNDGSDWSLGTPSNSNGLSGVHDAQADLDGNLWYTYSYPSRTTTVGRIDAKTGAVKTFKLDDVRGYAIGTHGITRDENGILWFNTRSNVARGIGGLARLDPKTEKITVYQPPTGMSGTAGTLDPDMKGNVWVTSPDGALRFNAAEEKFTEFKSKTYKNEHGTAVVYGLAADRVGNGWWLLMSQDLVDYSDIKTGKSAEFKLPPENGETEILTADERKLYDKFQPPDFNAPYPWAQGPRRMGADKDGDYVWIGDSFGGNLARVNIGTKDVTLVPLPRPDAQQPYEVAIDKGHNVWTNMWSADLIGRYDPATGKWTLFDLPTRGSETRYISLLERDGKMQVVLPYSRARKVAVMSFRSEADLQALKAQAERQ